VTPATPPVLASPVPGPVDANRKHKVVASVLDLGRVLEEPVAWDDAGVAPERRSKREAAPRLRRLRPRAFDHRSAKEDPATRVHVRISDCQRTPERQPEVERRR
jgi:hypothetical protein